jgi:hypothetical protein
LQSALERGRAAILASWDRSYGRILDMDFRELLCLATSGNAPSSRPLGE